MCLFFIPKRAAPEFFKKCRPVQAADTVLCFAVFGIEGYEDVCGNDPFFRKRAQSFQVLVGYGVRRFDFNGEFLTDQEIDLCTRFCPSVAQFQAVSPV